MYRGRCGRESGHTCVLSRSEVFLGQFPRWSCILRLTYTFLFLYFSQIIKVLTIFSHNFELQVEGFNIPENPQIHSTLRSPKFSMHHMPSRISSKISLSSRRIGLWFCFYFPFFEYFCLFYILLFKIQDSGSFHSPWLVNIRVDRLIVQMSRVEASLSGTLRACWGSERRLSIEWPGDWITP